MQASPDARSQGSASREARTAAIRSICRLAAQPSSSSAMPYPVALLTSTSIPPRASAAACKPGLDLAGVGQISGERVHWRALCLGIGAQGIQPGPATRADRNLCAGAGKRQRHFTADALAAACDEHAAAAEIEDRSLDPTLGLGQNPGRALTHRRVGVVCHHRSNLMPCASGSESE